jgi:integrase
MSKRVRFLVESCWERADKPEEGWVFPTATESGHVEKSTLKKQHKKVFEKINEEAEKNKQKLIRPFVLYDLRHTFLTRLGQSGCNVWDPRPNRRAQQYEAINALRPSIRGFSLRCG